MLMSKCLWDGEHPMIHKEYFNSALAVGRFMLLRY